MVISSKQQPAKDPTLDHLGFIKLLDDYEIDIFTNAQIEEQTERRIPNLQFIVENLTRRGYLNRIEKGKYCRFNFRNEFVIAQYLAEDGAIAYWSALYHHGLTDQIPNVIFVQTGMQKKMKQIFEVRYRFIKVKANKQTGYEKHGFGNHQYLVTDKEKTIVDCFDLPKYSGGFSELIKAFNKTTFDAEKLVNYGLVVGNLSVLKRIAYLSELFNKDKLEILRERVKRLLNSKYSLLDPNGINAGNYVSKWKLRLNIPEKALLGICEYTL